MNLKGLSRYNDLPNSQSHAKHTRSVDVCVFSPSRDFTIVYVGDNFSQKVGHFMASVWPSGRRFERLDSVLHERLPFSVVKVSYSPSDVFQGSISDRMDQHRVLAELKGNEECNEENPCTETSDTLDEILSDECGERAAVYLCLCGMQGLVSGYETSFWCDLEQHVQLVSIPDHVEELCDECFSGCENLSHVTFGESSSLKRIGKKAFYGTGLRDIHIPDSVEELCDKCFKLCESLSRVRFSELSSLKRIGKKAFHDSALMEIDIPDSVEELCEECFKYCHSLRHVTFSESSSLRRIGRGGILRYCSEWDSCS